MLDLFLDLITRDILTNPEHLEAYTEEMADDDDLLLDGVAIESEVTQIDYFRLSNSPS
jgi:antitoxin PrlF